MALEPRQLRFVQEYLLDLNATAAARRAGYAFPNVQGCRLLTYASVREAIAVALAEQADCSWLTRQFILNGLKGEAENHSDGSGAARVAAYKLLGQHLGMFEDTLHVKNETNIRVRFLVVTADARPGDQGPSAPAGLPQE